MKLNEVFPSNYLKAPDLQGHQVKVIISHVKMETLKTDKGDENKAVVYFANKDKGVVLNKTNAEALSMAYGDETDDWEGCEVILYTAMVQFQSKMVEAIRMKIPPRKPAGKHVVTSTVEQIKQQAPAPLTDDEMNDSIPF